MTVSSLKIRVGAAYDTVAVTATDGQSVEFDRAEMRKNKDFKGLDTLRKAVVKGVEDAWEGKPNAERHERRRQFNVKKRKEREQRSARGY